jgi:hypothetical protein
LLIGVGAALHLIRNSKVSVALALLLLGQAADACKGVIILILHEVVIPSAQLGDPVMLHIGIEQ